MKNESQANILKKVLELEHYLIVQQNILENKKGESFGTPPTPPVCKKVNRVYPEITPHVEVNKVLAFLPCIIFIPWPIIYYFCIYRKEQKAEIERIRNSPEYQAQCTQIDADYDRQQEELNKEYEALKNEYDTVTIPDYQQKLNAWTDKHDQEIFNIMHQIDTAKENLEAIYSETKIVPMQYRNLDALEYIYNMVSTSDYDVTYAINNYDTHRQRQLDTERMHIEEARLQEQQLANELADEQNAIAEKARRDEKFANMVGMVQHHNTNKILSGKNKR